MIFHEEKGEKEQCSFEENRYIVVQQHHEETLSTPISSQPNPDHKKTTLENKASDLPDEVVVVAEADLHLHVPLFFCLNNELLAELVERFVNAGDRGFTK